MTKTEIYKKTFTEDDWPGYDAISKKEKEIYENQEPTHWATIVPYELGGEDPLWAVDCFVSEKQEKHFHYISLGFSNLYYDEESAENEESGFGFELTFRHLQIADDPEKPMWVANFIQNIAKYVFSSGNAFDDYHYMSANGPIRNETETEITAFAFLTDPEMQEIESPNGKIKFLQVFGLTSQEYIDVKNEKYSIRELIAKHQLENPLLITDLNRK